MFLPGVQSSSSDKGQGRTLVGSSGLEFGERNQPNPGSADSEFKEKTGPNPCSEFGFGVRKREPAKPWFGRFGVWRKNMAEP